MEKKLQKVDISYMMKGKTQEEGDGITEWIMKAKELGFFGKQSCT